MESIESAGVVSPLLVRTHRGDTVNLFEPGQPSVLVFVPAAFTPVCGSEVCELAELNEFAQRLGVRLLIISCDTAATLRAWLGQIDPAGELIGLSDHWPHGLVARHFAAFDEVAGTALRRSFAITAAGAVKPVAASAAGVSRSRHDHERGVLMAADAAN